MKTYKETIPEIELKYKKGNFRKVKIESSTDCNKIFHYLFNADTIEYKEEMILLLLNRANNTIGWIKISTGGVGGTVCDPKMIFVTALNAGASGIILAHNHPSGNLNPSKADRLLTQRIKKAGELLDIHLLDHIIVTEDNGYYSFADNGEL